MAPASPSVVLAIPDRSLAERPETKDPDASDGRFAGLMAQFVHTPAPSETSKPSQGGPAKVEKEPPTRPIEPRTTAESQAPTSPSAPSTTNTTNTTNTANATGAAGAASAAGATGAAGASSASSAATAKAEPPASAPPAAGAPVAVSVLSQGMQAAANGSMPTPEPSEPPPTKAAKGEALSPLPATPPATRSPAPSVVAVTVEPAVPATPSGDPGPSSLQVERTPLPSNAQVDSSPLPSPVMAQAVVAESGPRRKELPPEPPKSEVAHPETALPTGKITKALEVAIAPQEPVQTPVQMPVKATSHPAMLAINQEVVAGVDKGAAQPTVKPESAPPATDALVAKPFLIPENAVPHAPDGSSLAALGTLPRAVEATPAAIPTAPPSMATPPSAPMVQVEGSLRWMLKGGAQEAQLQLHPESLGQVTIHLRVEGGEVHARLWITEPASVRAIQEGRPHLEASLKEQGLLLGSFDLQQGHRPFQEAPSAPAFIERSVPEAVPARQEAPAAASIPILNAHRVELYA